MKKLISSIMVALTIFILISCHYNDPHYSSNKNDTDTALTRQHSSYQTVSIISLIANPKQFDNRRVHVDGYLHTEFEGNVLYVSKDDFNYGLEKNGLSLNLDREEMKSLIAKGFQNRYVTVKGTFKESYLGHASVNSGGLDSLTVVDSLIKNSHRESLQCTKIQTSP